ncbi:MAG: trypsin-like peptidase domain-containing protein [Elusimicrobiaceae bacterium]|nr:trypsin-like peptidase domain-containing protein [Elusimicrobiaceae bacterium]
MKKPIFLILLLCMAGLFAWATSPAITGESDDRVDRTANAPEFEKAVVVLEITYKNGEEGLCSGSMIRPNVVLTAAHCLVARGKYHKKVTVYATGLPEQSMNYSEPETVKEKTKSVENILRQNVPEKPKVAPTNNMLNNVLNQAKQAQRQHTAGPNTPSSLAALLSASKFPSATSTGMRVPQAYLDDVEEGDENDFGVVFLNKPLGKQTGYLRMTVKSDEELQNKSVAVIGRGGDKPEQTLWRGDGIIGNVTEAFVYHDADMVGGNSGGPIMDIEDMSKIIALNNFEIVSSDDPLEQDYPNGGLRITKEIINTVSRFIREEEQQQ